ncbi:hypothetical protein sscle_07g060700 [Sclerotinia sclerotiorum 1980 UF-70]|uniref:AttH domain-containing protein n=1 Tax=Sclerotinia sclerotiorum (strain ATCC 18683 / 1980 / Ss-1) TaxID=665079 RepID=A0A1D9Q8L1_SCLS1|nr:hypothetical protein sscle_07g060700 [Sclerotinia sclerotiorum 1980 UF-70]
MSITSFLLLMLPAASNALYNFTPENASTIYDAELPNQYSLPESQLVTPPVNSFWSTHFLTSANSTEYVLLSHAFVLPSGTVTVRTSLLDASNPENYWQSTKNLPLQNNSTTKNGKLRIEAPGFEFSSNSNDSISTMVWSGSTDHYEYNLTVKATSRVLLNAGTGYFSWGNGNTSQWSLPSCQTSGMLTLDDQILQVDEERSMTWYDRQFGFGGVDSEFTWFGVHFPGSEVKASIWLSDNKDPAQHLRFATVRTDYGLEIVRFNVTIEPENAWTSPNSNYTYQTRWFLDFDNGDFLDIKSVRNDQEIYAKNSIFSSSPFTTVKGRFFGQKTGFALVDISPPTSLQGGNAVF